MSGVGGGEIWAVAFGGTVLDNGSDFSTDQNLECTDAAFDTIDFASAAIFYANLKHAASGTLFHPTIGGQGTIVYYIKLGNTPPLPYNYGAFAEIPYRSTDRNGDGDTDEDDENDLRTAWNGNQANADLNWSGGSDQDDIDILLREANRRDGNGQPYKRGRCLNFSGPHGYQQGDYHQYPPSAVTTLTACGVDSTTVRLSWICVADDGSSGRPATAYDIRKSTAPIVTEGDFVNATQLTGEPTPGSPGSTQTFDVTVGSGQRVYFAMKVVDDQGNVSGLGNSAYGATVASVADLSGQAGTYMVKLNWTSPGCSQTVGIPTGYDLRYSTSVINSSNFGNATSIGTGAPSTQGTTECLQVFDLNSNTTYYFALKFVDVSGHWSALSNVLSKKTKANGQTVFDCGPFLMAGGEDPPASALGLNVRRGGLGTAEMRFAIVAPPQLVGQTATLRVLDVAGRSVGEWRSPSMRAAEDALVPMRTGAVRAGVYYAHLLVGDQRIIKSVVITQ